MKATPTLERDTTNTKSTKPVTALDTANSALESASDLAQRVVSLAQLLAGFSAPESNDPDTASNNILGRLRTNAIDTNADIALAHEALDFIEGQIS